MQGSLPSSPNNMSLSDSSSTEDGLKNISDDSAGKLSKSLDSIPDSPRSEASDSSGGPGFETPDKHDFTGKWKGI